MKDNAGSGSDTKEDMARDAVSFYVAEATVPGAVE